MELIKKDFTTRVKNLASKISDDNLFLLSSSVSYYSALGLAPFLLILLWVASILGQNVQSQIIEHAGTNFSPQVAEMIKMVFSNVNKGVNVGSISGIVGLVILLSTCSLVFLQFRYAFDVIYGYFDPHYQKSIWETVREKVFAMVAVLAGITLLIVSFGVTAVVDYLWGSGTERHGVYGLLVLFLNFSIYLLLFTMLHKYGPSRRQKLKNAFKIAVFSSIFFIIGNLLLAGYLKGVAADSVYGAAGTLLVFLVWSYYSSFILFLSVEVFQYLRKIGKIRA